MNKARVKHQPGAHGCLIPVSNFISNLTARIFTSLIDHRQINNYDETRMKPNTLNTNLETSRNNNIQSINSQMLPPAVNWHFGLGAITVVSSVSPVLRIFHEQTDA